MVNNKGREQHIINKTKCIILNQLPQEKICEILNRNKKITLLNSNI